jgi:hypothetical protein
MLAEVMARTPHQTYQGAEAERGIDRVAAKPRDVEDRGCAELDMRISRVGLVFIV